MEETPNTPHQPEMEPEKKMRRQGKG